MSGAIRLVCDNGVIATLTVKHILAIGVADLCLSILKPRPVINVMEWCVLSVASACAT